MANTKISALSSASTPLSGSEIVPLNQSGTTDSVSVANLTAGRVVSALSFTAPTIGAGSSSSLSLQSNGATNATLDTSGNLLLGSASTIDSSFRLQVTGGGGSISHSVGTNATSFRFISANTTSQWNFGNNSPGVQNSGDYFAWSRLPNGGSWSEFMRLDSSGNLTNQTGNYIPATAGKGVTTGGAFNLGLGTNGSTSQVQIDTSGNILIGATTTAGSVSNSVNVVGGVFTTASGTTSIPNATATTIFTLPNFGTGVYIVTASIPGANLASLYASTVLITTQATTSVVSPLHSTTAITFTLSGLAVQITQTTGGTYTFSWTVIRLT